MNFCRIIYTCIKYDLKMRMSILPKTSRVCEYGFVYEPPNSHEINKTTTWVSYHYQPFIHGHNAWQLQLYSINPIHFARINLFLWEFKKGLDPTSLCFKMQWHNRIHLTKYIFTLTYRSFDIIEIPFSFTDIIWFWI
jgi:hypothetical protein